MEELGEKIRVRKLSGVFENIFVYEGRAGHEIVMMYESTFESGFLRESYQVREGDRVTMAVWRSLDEIAAAGAKLYPVGLDAVLRGL